MFLEIQICWNEFNILGEILCLILMGWVRCKKWVPLRSRIKVIWGTSSYCQNVYWYWHYLNVRSCLRLLNKDLCQLHLVTSDFRWYKSPEQDDQPCPTDVAINMLEISSSDQFIDMIQIGEGGCSVPNWIKHDHQKYFWLSGNLWR